MIVIKSFISWIGGKNLLKKEIVSRFPKEYKKYVEVFGGAGWVLFHEDRKTEEVYNDYNSDLVNLFRCVKHHESELKKELSFMLNSRELFEDFKSQYNVRGLTDIQRAAKFFMLIKTSYGSKMGNFGCVKRNINNAIDYLNAIQKRLLSVVIENRDFEALIHTYDRNTTLFYLDPPYYGTEKYYQIQFSGSDHIRLRKSLENINGKFILSYNDCDFVRNLYKEYTIVEIQRNNNLNFRYTNSDRNYSELIIMNY